MVGCTISGNRAGSKGGGIYGACSPEHTIVWDNCADSGVGDEWYANGGCHINCCNDFDSTGLDGFGPCYEQCLDGGPNIYVDPRFCDPVACTDAPTIGGAYFLRDNSPCLPDCQPICGLIGALDMGCGCPWISVWNGERFLRDNNILPQSESLAAQADATDYYRLRLLPQPKAGEYVFRVVESRREHTFADFFELWIVDHPSDVNVAVDERGGLFTYGNLLPPLKVTSSLGADRSELMSCIDDHASTIQANEVISLRFPSVNSLNGARLVVDFTGDGDLQNNQGVPKTIPGQNLRNDIVIQRQREQDVDDFTYRKKRPGYVSLPKTNRKSDKDTDRGDVIPLRPRENATVAIADVSTLLSAEEEDFVLDLKFPASHSIRFIGLDTSEQFPVETMRVSLSSAVHSRHGDVTGDLLRSDDASAELVPGEWIDLYFEFFVPVMSGYSRDVIIISEGYYRRMTTTHENEPHGQEPSLSNNYPNPFNPVTEMTYTLPQKCHVTIEIFNLLGQKVVTLVDEEQCAGHKSVRWDASAFASGFYFYSLRAGDFVQMKKMLFMK
jgi:hypothetical protein